MAGIVQFPPLTNVNLNRASPEQIRAAQETVTRNIAAAMDPSDRLLAQEAEAKLMSHARTGFWLGTFAGAAFAFRGRFAAGRAAAGQGIAPRLFFPSAKEGPGSVKAQMEAAKRAAQEGAKSNAGEEAGEAMRRGKAGLLGKAFGFGVIGSVAGTWAGVASGKRAANNLLDKSGRRDAIEAATARGIERAANELSQTMGGKVEVRPARRAQQGSDDDSIRRNERGEGIAYEEPGRELSQETLADGVGYSDRAPPQDRLPASLSDPSTAAASSSQSSSGPSRWDELRRSRAAPPSKWDALREASARSSGVARAAPGDDGNGNERELMDPVARDAADERERRRREFDALFDREARGGDDSMEEKKGAYR
ncbi:hypothetical protein JCM10450v2_005462 [Rhodotorula kratochvilovae]